MSTFERFERTGLDQAELAEPPAWLSAWPEAFDARAQFVLPSCCKPCGFGKFAIASLAQLMTSGRS